MSLAEQIADLLSADFYRTALRVDVVQQSSSRQGYARSKLTLAERIVELVLNEASLHERLTASQAVLDRKDAA